MEKFAELIAAEKPVLVDFFASWCGPCKTMHPVLEQLKETMGERLRIIKIDIDRNSAFASGYNVQSVPTLMLFKAGKCLWRQSGAMPLQSLIQEISTFI